MWAEPCNSAAGLAFSSPLFPQLCRSVARQHLDRETHHVRLEKEELLRLRRVAAGIAKEVKHFWESIQKVGGVPFVHTGKDP